MRSDCYTGLFVLMVASFAGNVPSCVRRIRRECCIICPQNMSGMKLYIQGVIVIVLDFVTVSGLFS